MKRRYRRVPEANIDPAHPKSGRNSPKHKLRVPKPSPMNSYPEPLNCISNLYTTGNNMTQTISSLKLPTTKICETKTIPKK